MSQIKQRVLSIVTGVVTGLTNGFFGGGGGMIIVPMLSFILKLKTKIAHATAIAIILPVTVAAAIIYFANGSFNFSVGLPVSGGLIVGGAVGAWLLGKLKAKFISKAFAFVILAAGVKLLFF